MDPMTMMLIFGGLKGLGGILGNHSQNNQLQGMMQQGPGQGEMGLLNLLQNSSQFNPNNSSGTQGFNAGQDALMQMLRASPFDTSGIFSALDPINKRATDTAVADLQANFGSLGERFGGFGAQAEGNLRAQMGETQAAQRAGIQQQTYENAMNRKQGAATQLEQGGLQQNNQALQFLQTLVGGFGAAGQMDQGRANSNAAIMQMIMGGGGGGLGGILGGAGQTGMDMSQLMFMLPMLQNMMGGKTGGSTAAAKSGNTGGMPDWMNFFF
jgi:hypothetical protein